MPIQNKKRLSERDICTKFITPALTRGGKWDIADQVREEVSLTKGRVIVRGQLMRWCDELEARLAAEQSAAAAFLGASLHAILTPSTDFQLK